MIRTVVVFLVTLGLASCSDLTPADQPQGASVAPEGSVSKQSGAACFAFTTDALRDRSWAFDGTIVSLGMRRDDAERPVRIAGFAQCGVGTTSSTSKPSRSSR